MRNRGKAQQICVGSKYRRIVERENQWFRGLEGRDDTSHGEKLRYEKVESR
jgi:hypothetical protein